MASLDFENEKNQFRNFYDTNYRLLNDANNSFVALINALVTHSENITISKVDGRVKEKEECIKKFNNKYRNELEINNQPYSIKDHISDLIGLRIVCLYEDDIEKISNVLNEHFDVIGITNKIAIIENTEGSFGYKGLHIDLKLAESRRILPEYASYSDFNFEIQIRTIIQDSWSVLDHKIKYKKSIPNQLKRRINTLAALFELADREFRAIRDSTEEEINKAEAEPEESEKSIQNQDESSSTPDNIIQETSLNAFSFLKIARHFFNDYDFDPHKVDEFAQEIVAFEPGITRGKFNYYMRENISKVKNYQLHFEGTNTNEKLDPFSIIKLCLYFGNKEVFKNTLTNVTKESFDSWINENLRTNNK